MHKLLLIGFITLNYTTLTFGVSYKIVKSPDHGSRAPVDCLPGVDTSKGRKCLRCRKCIVSTNYDKYLRS